MQQSDGSSTPPPAAHRVTTLELFFDLVFVFGITQVTSFLVANPTPYGYLRGLLLLVLLWWAWVTYSWLGTTVPLDQGLARFGLLAAMPALMVVGIGLPEWYVDQPGGFGGGLASPTVVALAYAAVRILHRALYVWASRSSPVRRAAVLRLSIPVLLACSLLIIGSFLPEGLHVVFVAAAIAVDLLGSLLGRGSGWQVNLTHFAERYGLIVIIALGESVVAIGAGASRLPLSPAIVWGATAGMLVAGTLWWLYFNTWANTIERHLLACTGEPQARLARDVYSYLHVFLMGGIVVLAVAVRQAVAELGNPAVYGTNPLLGAYAAWSLSLGLAAFLAGQSAVQRRSAGTWDRPRLVAAAGSIALLPAFAAVPAWAAIALAGCLLVLLAAWSTMKPRAPQPRASAGAF